MTEPEEGTNKQETIGEGRNHQAEEPASAHLDFGEVISPDALKSLVGVTEQYKRISGPLLAAINALQRPIAFTPPVIPTPTITSTNDVLLKSMRTLRPSRNPLVEGVDTLIEVSGNQHDALVALIEAQAEASRTERRHYWIAFGVALVAAVAAIIAAVAAVIAVSHH